MRIAQHHPHQAMPVGRRVADSVVRKDLAGGTLLFPGPVVASHSAESGNCALNFAAGCGATSGCAVLEKY